MATATTGTVMAYSAARTLPSGFCGLIGEYGWDHYVLTVFERSAYTYRNG